MNQELIPVSKRGAGAEAAVKGGFGEGGGGAASAWLFLPAINKFGVFNKLMSGGRRGAGRCVPGDISWRAAWQQRGAGREQAASRGCVASKLGILARWRAGLFGRTFPSGIHLCFPGIGQAAPGSEKSQMCGT